MRLAAIVGTFTSFDISILCSECDGVDLVRELHFIYDEFLSDASMYLRLAGEQQLTASDAAVCILFQVSVVGPDGSNHRYSMHNMLSASCFGF